MPPVPHEGFLPNRFLRVKRILENDLPTTVVAAAIIEREGRFLLTKRREGTPFGGFWEFPGGKQQDGESLVECLRREVWEELQILVTPPVLFATVRHTYPECLVELNFFRCSLESGLPHPVGCADMAWVPRNRLHTFTFPPADETVLKKLQMGR